MRWTDAIAGLSVAGLLLPEAVAYAGIAGLPPQRALPAAILGCLVYALAGRSRFAIVAPTSSAAAILGSTLAAFPGDEASRQMLATLAVGLVGLFFVFAALLRLGSLTALISRPVLHGFAFGIAVTIILRQLPVLLGVEVDGATLVRLVAGLAAQAPHGHPTSLATGGIALAVLLLLRRWPALPGAVVVLVAGIAAARWLDLPGRGVATVGAFTALPGWPGWPHLPGRTLAQLAEIVVPLMLVVLAESWGTMRGLALRHGDRLSPDREVGALGLANLASALVQGMPVGAGFSASAANEAAGARSRLAAILAAVFLAVIAFAAAPLVADLPRPVLAAIVIAALVHALDVRPFLRLWRLRRDYLIALAAALAVLAFGVLDGMLIAVLLSLAALVRRMADPRLVRLGRLRGGHVFVDVARHPDAVSPPGLAIWRPAQPLFYGNAEHILALVGGETALEPEARALVLSLEQSFDLDATTLDALAEFDAQMRRRGLTLFLARVRDPIRDCLKAAGQDDLVARTRFSVDEAVTAAGEAASARSP